MDESTDQKDTAQLAIFVKGVDKELNETEELLSLQSMNGRTTGADILTEVLGAFDKLGWTCPTCADSLLMVLDQCRELVLDS